MKYNVKIFNEENLRRTFVFFMLLVLAAIGFRQMSKFNEEAYRVSKEYIKRNEDIKSVLGKDVTIKKSKIALMNFDKMTATVRYVIDLDGEMQDASLRLLLVKSVGLWSVKEAIMLTSDGRNMQIDVE